jgi:hypothetical protein
MEIAAAMRRVDRRYRGAVQDVRLSDDAADGLSVVEDFSDLDS